MEPSPDAGSEFPARHPAAPPPGTELASHNDRCFGCGSVPDRGLGMRLVAGEGLAVHARFTVRDEHQGAHGLAHGGVLAAACDEALGGLLWLLRSPAVTAHLELDYRMPVPVGTEVHLRTWCWGRTGRKIQARGEGRLGSATGPVAVSCDALFLEVPIDHFTRHGQPPDGGHPSRTPVYGP